LGPNEIILNLWPVPIGSVKLTTGLKEKPEKRQPRHLLSTPALLSFTPTRQYMNNEGALSQIIINWIDDMIAEDDYPSGFLLAPPILEEWAPKGRLLRRAIIIFDLDWQLPPAEDVVWPPQHRS
jgi:hypothetical protein